MNKYTRLFIDQSREYLVTLDTGLRRIADEEDEPGRLADCSRLAHSIKGMALFEEQPAVAACAFLLERAFARAAREGISGGLDRHFAAAVAVLKRMIDEIGESGVTTVDAAAVSAPLEAWVDA